MLLSCIGAQVPVKKVLQNLISSKHRKIGTAIEDKDILNDYSESEDEHYFESIFEQSKKKPPQAT